MKYEVYSDSDRIRLIYDIFIHGYKPNQLSEAYQINYNTVRNILNLFLKQEGETYKHTRFYSDINNVALKIAIKNDPNLTERLGLFGNDQEQQS